MKDAQKAIQLAGGLVTRTKWLAPLEACDIFIQGANIDALKSRLNIVLPDTVDHAVLPDKNRRKRLLIADMDSTIIEQECIDEIARDLNKYETMSSITRRAMLGELDFAQSLRQRTLMLKGITTSFLERTYTNRITLNPGARTLVKTMKNHGARAALVSGGFSFFADKVAHDAGFTDVRANSLEIHENRLTGRLLEPVLDVTSKRIVMEELMQTGSLEASDTLAVGDGANDTELIKSASLGVCYYGKQVLQTVSDANISNGDLTALLYFQGYSKEEFLDE